MTLLELGLLALAALLAGSINGAIGSGSLVTLPVLIALGVEPTAAIATNTIAMVSSALGGTLAYRRALWAERRELTGVVVIAVLGGALGAALLLTTTPGALAVVVPILIVVALVLVVAQPAIARLVARRSGALPTHPYRRWSTRIGVLGTSIYGGYFAAAQGVLLLGVLGVATGRPIREVNGVKNLLTLTVNVTAAIAFVVVGLLGIVPVEWLAALVMAGAALAGGYAGGTVAKRMPGWVLRVLLVLVALASLGSALLG